MFISQKKYIEFLGVPGSGKTTLAAQIAQDKNIDLIPQHPSRSFFCLFVVRFPVFVFFWLSILVYECIATRTFFLFRFKASVFSNTCARVMYARKYGGILDEGILQRLLSLHERPVSKRCFVRWLYFVPLSSVYILNRPQSKVAQIRKKLSEKRILEWKKAILENHLTLSRVLQKEHKETYSI